MQIFSALAELFFPTPRICPFCNSKQDRLQICTSCRQKLSKIKEKWGQCDRCGTFGIKAQICDNCRNWPQYLSGNYAAVPYKGEYKEVLHMFKFNKQGWLAPVLVEIMHDVLPNDKYDIILPVPLHKKRFRERGFNQAALLAKQLASKLSSEYSEKILMRRDNTPHQTGLSRNQRRSNLKGVFMVVDDNSQIENKKILLVDDVITTGTTLYECAKTLKQAGAQNIVSITLAAGII